MLRATGSMAKQHVRCWGASGPTAGTAKSTRLTQNGSRHNGCRRRYRKSHLSDRHEDCPVSRAGHTLLANPGGVRRRILQRYAWSQRPASYHPLRWPRRGRFQWSPRRWRSTLALSPIRRPKIPRVLRAHDCLRTQDALSVIIALCRNSFFHANMHAPKRVPGGPGIDRYVGPIAFPDD